MWSSSKFKTLAFRKSPTAAFLVSGLHQKSDWFSKKTKYILTFFLFFFGGGGYDECQTQHLLPKGKSTLPPPPPVERATKTWIPDPLDHVGHRSKLFQPAVLVGWRLAGATMGRKVSQSEQLCPFFVWKVYEIKQRITVMQRQHWIIDMFHQQKCWWRWKKEHKKK